jgi:hypothetical protein
MSKEGPESSGEDGWLLYMALSKFNYRQMTQLLVTTCIGIYAIKASNSENISDKLLWADDTNAV